MTIAQESQDIPKEQINRNAHMTHSQVITDAAFVEKWAENGKKEGDFPFYRRGGTLYYSRCIGVRFFRIGYFCRKKAVLTRTFLVELIDNDGVREVKTVPEPKATRRWVG